MVDSQSYFGGKMDGFIQGFHTLFGLDHNNRNDYRRGRAVIIRNIVSAFIWDDALTFNRPWCR